MKKYDRLWFKALEEGIDERLISLLCKLKVVKADAWRHFKETSHIKLIEYRRVKEAKRSRATSSANNFSNPHRPPQSIKPTKARSRY